MELEKQITQIEPIEMVNLVQRARAGDRAAFDELLWRFGRSVYLTALRALHNEGDAEDLRQEVFIQVFIKLGQLHDPACFAGWVQQITRRMAINRMKRTRAALPMDAERLEAFCASHESPLADLLLSEEQEQVRKGLAKLNDLDRETLVAFYFDGCSLAEMSAIFEAPVGTIKRRLHVARKRLHVQLAGMASA
jgi:RNA polymerase sigma-70 factor (ECF subfamily)